MTKLFITGTTGYIGGDVLAKILKAFDFEIFALIRDTTKLDKLKQAGVTPVIGTLDDLDVIKEYTEMCDIIINAANNNHLASLEVIKDVLSGKKSQTLFLQISGGGVVADGTKPSEYVPDKVYSDIVDIDAINSLDDSQPHRLADKITQTMEAANPEFVKTAILSPPAIFGLGEGIFKKTSVQVPLLIKVGIKKKFLGTVYDGNTAWSHVNISDFSALFVLIIKKFLAGEAFLSGYKGYYFASDGTPHSWKDCTAAVVEYLDSKKLLDTTEIKEYTDDEFKAEFGLPPLYWGSNCITIADAARSIGWSPKMSGDKEFWDDIKTCTDYVIENKLV